MYLHCIGCEIHSVFASTDTSTYHTNQSILTANGYGNRNRFRPYRFVRTVETGYKNTGYKNIPVIRTPDIGTYRL